MSTYYFLLCDDHKEYTDAASRTFGGECPLGDSDETLIPFIIAHRGCNIRIIDEHDDAYNLTFEYAADGDPEPYEEWTKENCERMIEIAQEQARWR